MAINPQTAAIIGGAGVGAYTSDITENPLSGAISTGIGAGMGLFMKLPESSFKDMSKVSVGPSISMDLIEQRSTISKNAERPFEDILSDFKGKIDKRIKPILSYQDKIDGINRKIDKYSESINAKIQKEIEREHSGINTRFDKKIDKLTQQNAKRRLAIESNRESSRERRLSSFHKRRRDKQDREVSRYLETAQGKSELNRYNNWIESEKNKRKHLRPRDMQELRSSLYNDYISKNPRAFFKLRKIQEKYSEQNPKIKSQLFNPWQSDKIVEDRVIAEEKLRLNDQYLADDINNLQQQKQKWIDHHTKQINGYYKASLEDNELKRAPLLHALEGRFDKQFKMMDKIHSVLKNAGVTVPNNHKDIVDYLDNLTDKDLLSKVDEIISNPNLELIKVHGTRIDKFKSYSKQIQGASAEKDLAKWFTDILGNNVEDANLKAKMFLDRAVGGEVTLKDGVISFTDVDEKRVTVPLTSYSNGVRYHNQGKGVYSTVSQFNPYGLGYLEDKETKIGGVTRKLTAADVVKGYDPELMISHLDKNTPISSILGNIKSLFHYDSNEAGVRFSGSSSDFIPTSNSFLNKQGFIDLNFGLNYNDHGEVNPKYPFRKLKTNSEEGLASERVRLIKDKLGSELPPELAGHMFDGVSMNDLTTINTKGFSSFAAFAPLERNETNVGNRDTLVVNKNKYTKGLEEMLGTDRFNKQFSSSQVVRKLDVSNSQLFNEILSSIYGNDSVLSDGGGFFNMGTEDFKVKDRSTLKIPIQDVSELKIVNSELAAGLRSPAGITEHVKNNPINITNKPIAYDSLGNPIQLKDQYTSGQIVDAYSTDKDFRFVVESEFNPNLEGEMKFYSVGTKSLNTGVSPAHFNIRSEIGVMINDGTIARNSTGHLTLNGAFTNDINDIKQEAVRRVSTAIENKTYVPFSLIGSASDTGVSTIVDAIGSGLKGNSIYDSLMSRGGSQEVSALTAMMFTENKAAIDLTATVAVGLNSITSQFDEAIVTAGMFGNLKTGSVEVKDLEARGILTSNNGFYSPEDLHNQRKAFNNKFLNTFNAENFLQNKNNPAFLKTAYDLVDMSGAVTNYKSGIGFAVGSMNKGMSIVGAGNRAGMSWNARANLITSGFTNSQLDLFGTKSDNLLYEVRSVIAERHKAKSSINSVIDRKESRFLSMMSGTALAENRLDTLSKLGDITQNIKDNPFLSYNLAYDGHDIKSINLSRISTTRSGTFEKDSKMNYMMKELDKHKFNVISADVDYKNSTTKADREVARKGIQNALEEYNNHVFSMFSGDKNLLKGALSLESKHSDIMQVKGIGGSAERFANSRMTAKHGFENIWFLSKDEAEHKAKQLGVELKYNSVDGFDHIKRPVFVRNGEEIPLASLLTREPAQGPLSSDLVSWYVDETITKSNRSNAFVSNSSLIYAKGMFGDMDQDTVQTLLGNFKTRKEFDEIESNRKGIRKSFKDMEGILNSMKIKNSNQKQKTLADFESNVDYVNYRISSALKGRNRKTLAAASTGLAVSYSKALELEFGHLGINNAKLLEGRILGHQLIENLLKSAHLDTDAFSAAQEQAVEKLNRLRNGYLGKPKYDVVTKEGYEKGLREELPKFLNLHNMKSVKDKTHLLAIIENIITAELNHSVKIGRNPLTPLDLPEHRFSKDSAAYIDAINTIVEQGDITTMDYESASKHLRKSTGQVYSGVSDLIFDTFKNNKKVILGGLGAMAGVAMLSRSDPSFSDSRSNTRQHAANMLRSSGEYDSPSVNNTPMGMDTNTNSSGYLTPKGFNSKGIKVSGEFVSESEQQYNNFNSMISTDNIEDQAHNITNSLFGDGIRSARLQTN